MRQQCKLLFRSFSAAVSPSPWLASRTRLIRLPMSGDSYAGTLHAEVDFDRSTHARRSAGS
jgi:hypothetical protein